MCTADPRTADNEMFGATPCRSPFGAYFLKVPKKKGRSSILKNDKKLDVSYLWNMIKFSF